MLELSTKPKIQNVTCTADLNQKVSMIKLSKLACGIYDKAKYRGVCGYIKTPEMSGRVTVFASGKIVSVGSKSIKKSIEQLYHAKFLLIEENLISEIKLTPKIRNIVSTIDVSQKISVEYLSPRIAGANYNPEVFPALILKGLNSCSFLIFSSGKIVFTGAKSVKEMNESSFELLQKLNHYLK